MINALLLTGALAIGGLIAAPAEAQNIQVTTTGVITSGSDPINLFGTGSTNLTGDSYALTLLLSGFGPSYYSSGNGTSASDFDPLTGSVTATVGGHSVTTQLVNGTTGTLSEDLYDLSASITGLDGANQYTNVSQLISCNSQCVPYADLLTPFSYLLGSADFGSDSYTFELSGNPGGETVSFFGAPTDISYSLPEPGSLALLATGLLGLGVLVRRRRV